MMMTMMMMTMMTTMRNEKKRKISFFLSSGLTCESTFQLDDDFKQSSQDTQDCKRRNVISQANPETHHPPTCN